MPLHRSLTDADIRRALEALPALSLVEEQCLFRLCCLSLLRGYAWIRQEALAPLLRCSTRHLRSVIARLCAHGLLETVRSAEGLTYLPQWQALGLEAPTPRGPRHPAAPEHAAGRDRNLLPVHLGSTSRSDEKVQGAQLGSVQQAGNAPVGLAAAPPVLAVPLELERALRDKLGVSDYRALARLFRGELARSSPELSVEALRRLLTRREVRNAAGLFVTMLRDDLAARDEALASGEPDGLALARPAQARVAEVRALHEQVHEALVRGDFDRMDALRDRIARLTGAPTREEQRATCASRARSPGRVDQGARPDSAPPPLSFLRRAIEAGSRSGGLLRPTQ